MFSDLRTFLKLFGVLKYNANHSNIPPWFLQLFIVLFSLASQLLFIVGCLLYCFHNLDFIETIKVAGYAYNTSLCCAVIYIYLVYNRENCLRLIDSWDQLIQNSTNYYFQCILSWILNKIFFFCRNRGEEINAITLFRTKGKTIKAMSTYIFIHSLYFWLDGDGLRDLCADCKHCSRAYGSKYLASNLRKSRVGFSQILCQHTSIALFLFNRLPFEEGSSSRYFGLLITISLVAIVYYPLTAVYLLIIICMCNSYEACVDDLVINMDNPLSAWKQPNYIGSQTLLTLKFEFVTTLKYQMQFKKYKPFQSYRIFQN